MKNIRLQIEDDLHREMKYRAINDEMTLHQLIVKALKKYIKK